MESIRRGRGRAMIGRGIGRGQFLESLGTNVGYTSVCGRGFSAEIPVQPLDHQAKPQHEGEIKVDFEKSQGRDEIKSVEEGKITPRLEMKPVTLGRGRLHENLLAHNQTVEETKRELVRGLSQFENNPTQNATLIRLSLDYFGKINDVQFYIEEVFNSFLKTPDFVVDFAMNAKIITCLKIHGEKIKCKIFSKLQTMYQQLPTLEEINGLDERKKLEVANFCFLMGQMYFRFRPFLDSPDRYHVLAGPSAHCMIVLLHLRGTPALIELNKLLTVNLKALMEEAKEKMEDLCVEIHRALLKGEVEMNERVLMLCALDKMMCQDSGKKFPHNLSQFYQEVMGSKCWASLMAEEDRVKLLADIPPTSPVDRARFDLDIKKYIDSTYVDL